MWVSGWAGLGWADEKAALGRPRQRRPKQAKAGQRSEANGQRGQQQTMHAELAHPRRARAGSDDLTWLALRVRVKVELPIFPSPGPRPPAGFSSTAGRGASPRVWLAGPAPIRQLQTHRAASAQHSNTFSPPKPRVSVT